MSFPDMTRPSWDFRRGPAAARVLVALGVEHGLDETAALAATGLAPAALDDRATLVEAAQELAIARNLIVALGDPPGLGAAAGKRYTLGMLGVWGFALLSSPTVRDVLVLGTRYAALSFAFIRPRYDEDARRACVELDDGEIPSDVRAFFVERELAKLATLLPTVLGSPEGVVFETRLDGARGGALRRALPGVQLRLGRPSHSVTMPAARLGESLPQSDRDAARSLEQQCRELLDRRRRAGPVAARVRGRLLARPADMPDMATVAREIAVDERTLRRRLREEGTTFRAIVDEVREMLATEFLTTAGLTIDETAARLGYHDAAGFSRAFTRWTGARPGALRAGSR